MLGKPVRSYCKNLNQAVFLLSKYVDYAKCPSDIDTVRQTLHHPSPLSNVTLGGRHTPCRRSYEVYGANAVSIPRGHPEQRHREDPVTGSTAPHGQWCCCPVDDEVTVEAPIPYSRMLISRLALQSFRAYRPTPADVLLFVTLYKEKETTRVEAHVQVRLTHAQHARHCCCCCDMRGK